jgi:hypothetical protein
MWTLSTAAVVMRNVRAVTAAEPDGQVVQAISGSVDLPDGSALWRMSATVPRAAYEAMRTGEQPPLASVTTAGKTWVFVVDEMSAPRAFASTDVSIRGVSLAALADAPYELARQWTSDAPTTAAQIATLAQTFTGLSVAWQLPDWPVPAGGWSFTGTPWGAVLQPAAAVGAVVEADRQALAVRVTSRYPVMPNEWATSVPDVQIPWQAVESEAVTAADRPAYTGVYVTGPATTIAAVRLAGTSGAEQAPLVAGDLLTDLDGQIEHGRTLLAQSGGAQTVSRTLQVLTGAGEPGIIDRGAMVRWVDPEDTWVGMVRAVRLDWQFGLVRQTVACERRTSFPVGSVVPPPKPALRCDPWWADVGLMLPCDETGGAGTPDVAVGQSNAVMVNGVLWTADARFGDASIQLQGNSSRILVTAPSGWVGSPPFMPRTEDFCVECWYLLPAGQGDGWLIEFPFTFHGGTNASQIGLYTHPLGLFSIYRTDSLGSPSTPSGGAGIPTGRWFHLAWERASGTTRVFVDGAIAASWSDPYDYNTSSLAFMGSSTSTGSGVALIDEVRVTVGASRYGGTFTPPSAPFFRVACA